MSQQSSESETKPFVLDGDSLINISCDVHDVWRSSLDPGDDQPFEPDFMEVDGEMLDVANTASRQLPESLQKISVASGSIILSMLHAQLAHRDEINSMHIEKMSIHLFGLWDVIKYGQPLTTERGSKYLEAPARIRILDQRLVLAGVASLLDDERFPAWAQLHDMDRVRELPGVRRYGEQGRRILDIVRNEDRPVALGSEVDWLYDQ